MRRFATVTAVLSLVIATLSVTPAVFGFSIEEVVTGVASIVPGEPAVSTTPAADHLPDNDHARGVVFDGLRPAGPDGPCAGGFEMTVNGETLCTPGPDRGPEGRDVRRSRSIPEAQAYDTATDGSATAEATSSFPVVGDGTSGNRVVAVYAVAADRADRYADVAPMISEWAANVDTRMNQSAALTEGERHVRFVTDAAGTLAVEKVIMPADGDDSFGATISALKAAGYNDPSRKYLIWTDANLYCGIATIYSDDKPTQDNYNNGSFAQYARVDAGCWGFPTSVELHELVHTLGAVQQSAPHSTPGWHCTDEYDRMCYKDSTTVEITYVCEPWMEDYLDCGHDDYFNTSPSAGSYLATHWNVANSSFLHAGPLDDPPPPPPPPVNEAPVVTVAGPATVTMPDGAVLDGTVDDDGLPGPYTTVWSMVSGPAAVTFGDATAVDTTASFSVAGTYVLGLVADDGDLSGDASLTIVVEEDAAPPPPPPVNEAPVVTVTGPTTVTMPDGAVLDGTVDDDGLPGPYTTVWSMVSGPAAVTFGDATAVDTTASFSVAGTYVLRLVADDGELTGDASLTIVVEEEAVPPPPPPTDPETVTDVFEDSLNKKWVARTYETTVAAGPALAVLEIPVRNKNAPLVYLTVNLYDAAGELVATVFGPTGTELEVDLEAGVYVWEVTGDKASYSLSVTYLTP